MEQLKREDFIRDTIDLNSPDCFDWDIISVSPMYKENIRDDMREKEIIQGYANATNCLAKKIKEQNHCNSGLILRQNSLVLPFIFLCRHTVELTLKYLQKRLNIPSPNKHRLSPLWATIERAIVENIPTKKDDLKGMTTVIAAIEEVDPDELHARYSKSQKGDPYNSKFKAIKVSVFNKIVQSLSSLVDQL